MKTHTLQRTGMPPLQFDGVLVAEADTEHLEALRWYTSSIYQVGDRYVVSVGFRSNWDGEAEHDTVFVCDSNSHVISALRSYDVLPPGRGYPGSEQYRDRQAKLRSYLQRDYDTMISDLLDSDLFVETLDKDQDAEYRQMDWVVVDQYLAITLSSIPITKNEACAICDANNGSMLWSSIIPNLIDTHGLDEKWDIDTVALVRKLKFLTNGELLALAFGVARFWRNCELPTDKALKKAGFAI